jgi:hypothetical protein
MTFISSITSTNLRTLVITPYRLPIRWGFFLDEPCWIRFDDVVCGLVDRLRVSGYVNTLEVEFLANIVGPEEEADHERILPKFKEKGRVRVVEISSDRFQEWP